MTTIASFYVHHPSAVQLLHLTEERLVAGTVSGLVSILDLQCRHIEGSDACEHRTTIQVGRVWHVDCFQDMLVTGNEDGKVRIWNLRTGLLQQTLSGHSQRVVRVLISNSDTVISSSIDLTVIVWNVQSGERRHVLTGHDGASHHFLQHGNLLFAGGQDGTVQVWNLDNGQRVHVLKGLDDRPLGELALNQDASLLATAEWCGDMGIWDVNSGVRIAQCKGHSRIITQFTNLNENQLITSAADGSIRTWEWTGNPLSTMAAHEGAVRGFAITDQHMVSVGMDGRVRQWTRRDNTLSCELRERVSSVMYFKRIKNTVALSMRISEGRFLVEIWDISQIK